MGSVGSKGRTSSKTTTTTTTTTTSTTSTTTTTTTTSTTAAITLNEAQASAGIGTSAVAAALFGGGGKKEKGKKQSGRGLPGITLRPGQSISEFNIMSLANNLSQRFSVLSGLPFVSITPSCSTDHTRKKTMRTRYRGGSISGLGKTAWPVAQTELLFLPEFPVGTDQKMQLIFYGEVSRGAFGQVFHVQCSYTHRHYAMKVLAKSQVCSLDVVQQVKQEVMIQQMCCHHPFITPLTHHWQTRKLLIVMTQYVAYGELHQLWQSLGSFPENLVALYIAEIAVTIDFLHNAGVVYRDLKMENLLLDEDGHIKLIDFGLAKWLRYGAKTASICGTLHLMAPEVCQGLWYGHGVDWWSLGVIAYCLIVGRYPAVAQLHHTAMTVAIAKCDYSLPGGTSPALCSLVSSLLQKEPEGRLHSLHALQREFLYRDTDLSTIAEKQVAPRKLLEEYIESKTRQNFEDFAGLTSTPKRFQKFGDDREIPKLASSPGINHAGICNSPSLRDSSKGGSLGFNKRSTSSPLLHPGRLGHHESVLKLVSAGVNNGAAVPILQSPLLRLARERCSSGGGVHTARPPARVSRLVPRQHAHSFVNISALPATASPSLLHSQRVKNRKQRYKGSKKQPSLPTLPQETTTIDSLRMSSSINEIPSCLEESSSSASCEKLFTSHSYHATGTNSTYNNSKWDSFRNLSVEYASQALSSSSSKIGVFLTSSSPPQSSSPLLPRGGGVPFVSTLPPIASSPLPPSSPSNISPNPPSSPVLPSDDKNNCATANPVTSTNGSVPFSDSLVPHSSLPSSHLTVPGGETGGIEVSNNHPAALTCSNSLSTSALFQNIVKSVSPLTEGANIISSTSDVIHSTTTSFLNCSNLSSTINSLSLSTAVPCQVSSTALPCNTILSRSTTTSKANTTMKVISEPSIIPAGEDRSNAVHIIPAHQQAIETLQLFLSSIPPAAITAYRATHPVEASRSVATDEAQRASVTTSTDNSSQACGSSTLHNCATTTSCTNAGNGAATHRFYNQKFSNMSQRVGSDKEFSSAVETSLAAVIRCNNEVELTSANILCGKDCFAIREEKSLCSNECGEKEESLRGTTEDQRWNSDVDKCLGIELSKNKMDIDPDNTKYALFCKTKDSPLIEYEDKLISFKKNRDRITEFQKGLMSSSDVGCESPKKTIEFKSSLMSSHPVTNIRTSPLVTHLPYTPPQSVLLSDLIPTTTVQRVSVTQHSNNTYTKSPTIRTSPHFRYKVNTALATTTTVAVAAPSGSHSNCVEESCTTAVTTAQVPTVTVTGPLSQTAPVNLTGTQTTVHPTDTQTMQEATDDRTTADNFHVTIASKPSPPLQQHQVISAANEENYFNSFSSITDDSETNNANNDNTRSTNSSLFNNNDI